MENIKGESRHKRKNGHSPSSSVVKESISLNSLQPIPFCARTRTWYVVKGFNFLSVMELAVPDTLCTGDSDVDDADVHGLLWDVLYSREKLVIKLLPV